MLNRTSGPELVESWGLNGPLLPLNLLEKVGGEAPNLFELALRWEGGRFDTKHGRLPARNRYSATYSKVVDYDALEFADRLEMGARSGMRGWS